MRPLVLLCLLTTLARADAVDPKARRAEVLDAIAKRDVAAVERLVQLPLRLHQLWFDTKPCQAFRGKQQIGADQLPALVDCLAGLGVHVDIGSSVSVGTYGPGIPLYVMLDASGGVRALATFGISNMDPDQVLIEPTVFAKHVARFRREIVPDAKTKQQLDRDAAVASVMVSVCVNARGKIESVRLSETDSTAYAALIEKAARRWKVKPFTVRGKGVRACSMLLVGYPEDRLSPLAFPPPPPPPPPPPTGGAPTAPPSTSSGPAPQNVAPTLLEAQRISGNKQIVPDDLTKVAIARKRLTRIIGSWKLCIDDTGKVTTVRNLKTTGFVEYDTKIEREMWKWRYRPYLVNGKPVKVCTAVTFIYSQAPAEPEQR